MSHMPMPSRRIELSALARAILAGRLELSNDFHPGIRKALQYIAKNFHRPIALSDAAAQSGMSRYYFCRTFHQTTGVTFKLFLSAVRVEKARELLENPWLGLEEVSEGAGFNDLRQLERSFKRLVGCTPKEYRLKVRGR